MTTQEQIAKMLAEQARRFLFASIQDKSPIIGIIHASYAMALAEHATLIGADMRYWRIKVLAERVQNAWARRLKAADPYYLALDRDDRLRRMGISSVAEAA